MRALLDTSVLIGEEAPDDLEAAISVASITELHFGLLIADDADERARRTDRHAAVEAAFDPLPVTIEVARARGTPGGSGQPAVWQPPTPSDRPGHSGDRDR